MYNDTEQGDQMDIINTNKIYLAIVPVEALDWSLVLENRDKWPETGYVFQESPQFIAGEQSKEMVRIQDL